MGIVIRQSIKSTIVIYSGIAIGTVNILWLYPKFFSPEQIGLIRVLQDLPFLLALFFRLGASNLSDRFFFHFRDGENKHNGFLLLILLYPLAGMLIFISGFLLFNDYWKTFFNNSPLLLEYFYFIIPLVFFVMYADILESYMRVNFLTVFPNLIKEVGIRILFTIMAIFFGLKILDVDSLIIYFTSCYAAALLVSIVYLKSKKILFLNPDSKLLKKGLMQEMGTYLLFMIPGTVGSIIAQKIDTLMIVSIKDLKSAGVYSIAYFIGTVVEVPKRSIAAISTPILSKALKENDYKTVEELYKKSSLTQLLAGSVIFVLVWINIDDLFNLIPNSEEYREGKYVILFIGLAKLIDMVTGINGEIIQLSKYFRFNIVAIVFLAFITVFFNLMLIEKYSITGIGIAFAITMFLFNGLKTIFLYVKMKYHPFSIKMIHIILLNMIITSACYYLPFQTHSIFISLVIIAVKSAIVVIVYFITIRKFKISEDVNNLIDSFCVKYNIKLPL